ncbi:Phosphate-import permease protein phnE [Serratia fonticola]|uniref:Phosphate-import permease protein phnE n=1 Tax=Serratia fonticola TaxID=47917 RepID=A0A4U9TZ49_SERFO|nr:Phosphate-import permease protein phnE [Serratia fonticola]
MSVQPISATNLQQLKQQNPEIFSRQGRYLRTLGMITVAIVLYYVFFFLVCGISWPQFANGCQQISRYFMRMFVWHDFANWPFGYYFQQIFITLAIVFAGTITATLLALPLSFLAARNVMSSPVLRPIATLVRRLLDILRGIDMAIWGLIFVRAVGMGPLAGVLAIVMQDIGLLGKLYAEGHEAVINLPVVG